MLNSAKQAGKTHFVMENIRCINTFSATTYISDWANIYSMGVEVSPILQRS